MWIFYVWFRLKHTSKTYATVFYEELTYAWHRAWYSVPQSFL